jgi:hypothetical protein
VSPALTTLLDDATNEVTISTKRVERLAKLLADEMGRLHGLRYRIQIDHSPGLELVFVVPRLRDL